jgi:hypothetical protein
MTFGRRGQGRSLSLDPVTSCLRRLQLNPRSSPPGSWSARQASAPQVQQVRRNEGLMSAQSTAISLNAKQAIWWILVTIQPLIVEVDGVQTKGTWGDQTLPVAPGSHRISVSWKFYWVLPVQRATLDVTVDPSAVVSLRYKVRWLIFLPGKLSRTSK